MKQVSHLILLLGLLWHVQFCMAEEATGSDATDPSTEAKPEHHQYLVVGAGPGGLQTGVFLTAQERDYVVLEKTEAPGSFYTQFPRHARLNSINKRFTGQQENPEFQLRHDWNSLLPGKDGDSGSPRFTTYSEKFFPTRQEYAKYLKDYTEYHEINVLYGRKVVRVTKEPLHAGTGPNRQPLYHVFDDQDKHWTCEILIMATSRDKPYIPEETVGIDLTTGYEDLEDPNEDPAAFRSKYENKRILVLGLGNAAFETASALSSISASVHVLGRSKGGLRQAHLSHYLGDLRAVNNDILDTFLLNSLDTINVGFDVRNAQFVKDEADGLIYLMTEDGLANPHYRKGYDFVIRCLGWQFDASVFDEETVDMEISASGKFPVQTIDYESISTPNLFFAGDLMHFQDYKESSGGFVQGYRHLSRSLVRRLGQRFHGDSLFRSPEPDVPATPEGIARALHDRIQVSSGMYHMNGFLSDIVIWDTKYGEGDMADYVEEVILTGVTQQESHPDSLMWSVHFNYGQDSVEGSSSNQGVILFPGQAHLSRFLHPIVRFYRPPSDEPGYFQQLAEFHIMEDFQGTWDDDRVHFQPLVKFIERCIENDYRSQGEILEARAGEMLANLTSEQRQKDVTVVDPFFGEFQFPGLGEQPFAKLRVEESEEALDDARAALKDDPIVHREL